MAGIMSCGFWKWDLFMKPQIRAWQNSLNANKATFANNPTMLTALNQLKEMYDKGYFGTDALSNEFANTEASMAGGKYAMTVNRFGLPSQIHKAYPDVAEDNFGFFVIPLADNQIWNVKPGCSKQIHLFGVKEYRGSQSLLRISDQARKPAIHA